MKSKLLFLLFLTASGLMAQKLPRQILKGQVVAEAISVEDILITNKTAKTATISKKDGSFQILVRVKDTLVFSGFNFPRQVLVLNDSDLKFKELKINIESQANPLDEVVINRNALSGDLKKDSENIRITRTAAGVDNLAAMDRMYYGDLQSSPDITIMPGYLNPAFMMDFTKIGRKLVRSFKRSEAQKNRNKDISSFSVVVQNRFSDDFFRNTLKMDKTQTDSFLNFCERDPKAKELLSTASDFELIEFLTLKKQEYLALKK